MATETSDPDSERALRPRLRALIHDAVRRRLTLSILMLLALLVAPFGRMAAAEAMAMPHHAAPAAMAGHCGDTPAPDQAPAERGAMTIDCLVACATIAAPDAPELAVVESLVVSPQPCRLSTFIGIQHQADPPPPRRS